MKLPESFFLPFLSFLMAVAVSSTAIAEDDLSHIEGLPLDDSGQEKHLAGWGLHIDNDLFIPGSDRDQDYTGGIGFTLAGRIAETSWWSLDPILGGIDNLIGLQQDHFNQLRATLHAAQLGSIVFSPSDIDSDTAIFDDRPFASLVYLSNSRRYIAADDKPVYQSVFTLGVLGSSIGKNVQNSIHKISGSTPPNGWDHQISDGGEPTFQYALSRQALLATNEQRRNTEYEFKYNVGGSVGYITETNLSLSGRWGLINTPWWSFTPENSDYNSQPAPVVGNSLGRHQREVFVWGGIKVRARAYNAFLQGQFRDSEVTFDHGEINHVIGEAWLGLTTQFGATRWSYVVRYNTKEIKEGSGARNPLWAGILFSMDY